MTKFHTDKQQIIDWLEKHKVKRYKLVSDEKYGFIVDINGDVDLSDKELINIPVKFNEVSEYFGCSNNKLNSLEFCPHTVGSHFYCSHNQLPSLEFCPKTVGGSFYCENNPELKEIQEVTDFKFILLEHKKALITKFSDKLENDLIHNSKRTTRIKI